MHTIDTGRLTTLLHCTSFCVHQAGKRSISNPRSLFRKLFEFFVESYIILSRGEARVDKLLPVNPRGVLRFRAYKYRDIQVYCIRMSSLHIPRNVPYCLYRYYCRYSCVQIAASGPSRSSSCFGFHILYRYLIIVLLLLYVWRISRLTPDGTAEPVSRDEIPRLEQVQGNIVFIFSVQMAIYTLHKAYTV